MCYPTRKLENTPLVPPTTAWVSAFIDLLASLHPSIRIHVLHVSHTGRVFTIINITRNTARKKLKIWLFPNENESDESGLRQKARGKVAAATAAVQWHVVVL